MYTYIFEYYAPEKGSDRHHRMILNKLEELLEKPKVSKSTDTVTFLHQIAEKIHRRSMIILFTDMFQTGNNEALFNALQHLKHNKHEIILFHVMDEKVELELNLENRPYKFIDLESGEVLKANPSNLKEEYSKQMKAFQKELEYRCGQYRIDFVNVDVNKGLENVLMPYLLKRTKMH